MKKIGLIIALIAFLNPATGQDKIQIGLEVSPSWKINVQRSKTTSIWSFQSGYGFTIGVPVKFTLDNFNSFNTGLNYVFTSFDNFSNNVLVSSTRFNTLQIPLSYNINVKENWFAILGGGVDYNFVSQDVSFGNPVSINSITNSIQPYLTLGINSVKELTNNNLEIGVQGRYQLLDIWNKNYQFSEATGNHILALDVILRFYF